MAHLGRVADDKALAAGAVQHLLELVAGVVLVVEAAEALLAEGAVPHYAAPVTVHGGVEAAGQFSM